MEVPRVLLDDFDSNILSEVTTFLRLKAIEKVLVHLQL